MSAIMNMSTFAPTKVVAGQRQMRAARSATTVAAAVRPATFSGMHTKSLGFAASRTFSEKVTQKMSAIKTQGSRTVATMAKKSVGSLTKKDLEGKRVFVRADLNVPLDGDLNISDDTRIRAAVPTIKYLVDNGAKVLLTSHLGRPKDGPEDKFRLNPVVPRLSELLGAEVKKVDDCVGDTVSKAVAEMANGSVLILENVRFYKEETKNEAAFAEKVCAASHAVSPINRIPAIPPFPCRRSPVCRAPAHRAH